MNRLSPIPRIILVHLTMLIGCLPVTISASFAQEPASMKPGTLKLDSLKGYSSSIYFSTGKKPRAEQIAGFLEGAARFFQKEIGFTPESQIYILAPDDWKYMAAAPLLETYGFPHNLDHLRLVVASDDNAFFRSFLPPLDQLPPTLGERVKTAYAAGNGEFSMQPFFDLLALHELGHSYTAQAGLKMHRHWMGELFVNIMLHTYVAEEQKHLLPALETFPDLTIAQGTADFTYTTLADFERLYTSLGMGPRNYGWYQCRLHRAAKDIYDAGGKDVLQKLWQALKKHQSEMTDDEFVKMLKEEVHPSVAEVFTNWDKK